MLEFAQFKLTRLVLELRFDAAYLLWDRAGAIFTRLALMWPGTKLAEANPAQQVLKGENIHLVTSLQSVRLILFRPTTIMQRAAAIEQTVKVWVEQLELQEFTRVGTRCLFNRSYESEEAANGASVEAALVATPRSPIFGFRTPVSATETVVVWKDQDLVTRLAIKPEHKRLQFSDVEDFPEEKIDRTLHSVLIDFDHATAGKVDATKFRTQDWLKGVQHIIHRDMPRYLNRGQND